MMRKFLAPLLAVVLLLSVASGCAPASQTNTTGDATTAAQVAAETTTTAAPKADETATSAAAANETAETTTVAATTAATTAAATTAATESTAQPAVDAKPMRYYMPGTPQLMNDEVAAEINARLARDGVPLIYMPYYVPWDQWSNKTNVMLASGEEFELIHIMEDGVPTSLYVARDGLAPLGDVIKNYAPKLIDLFEPVLWECATVGGEIYSIPAYWRDASGDGEGTIGIRVDKFEEFGLPIPKTPDEALEVLPRLNELWKAQDGMDRYVFEHSPSRSPVALHRSQDAWPYYVTQDGVFVVWQSGEAGLFFETDEFRQDAEFMRKLNDLGLLHPDVLNMPNDLRSSYMDYGDFLMNIMTGPGSGKIKTQGVDPNNEVLEYWFNDDKPYLMCLPLLNSNGVPSTTSTPELGPMFLEWVYTSQENHDLLILGLEGVTYDLLANGDYMPIKNELDQRLYYFDFWMISYVPLHRWSADDESTDRQKADFVGNIFPDKTLFSPVIGFNFNPESVATQMSNMAAEYTASILPIKLGILPYDENFGPAMEKMRAAGCDTVIAEYQKQLAAHIASKN